MAWVVLCREDDRVQYYYTLQYHVPVTTHVGIYKFEHTYLDFLGVAVKIVWYVLAAFTSAFISCVYYI